MTTFAFPTLSLAAPSRAEWGLKSNTQVFTSPLNGSVQTMELMGARWTGSFSWDTLQEADAALLQAFLVKLRGQANRFTLWPYHRPQPRGTIALASVTVSGAVAQLAATLNLAACGAGATLKAGDYFAVAGELKMATADFTANGAGLMSSVTFEPPVRAVAGFANGAAVTTSYPTATFIVNDPHAKWQTRAPIITDVPFDFTEVW
jgi:hypothetical protein